MTRSAPLFSWVVAAFVLGLGLAASGTVVHADGKIIVVPPGNRSATQPEISSSSPR